MTKKDPLYLQMRDYLMELIERNRHIPNYKLPSENQLALKFNASRISAKHALQMLEEENFIYRQRGRGSFINQSMFPQPSVEDAERKNVAVIFPFLKSYFMMNLVEGIREALTEQNLDMTMFLTGNIQEREVQYLRDAQENFKGILLFPSVFARYHEEVLRLVLNRFPLVQIDRYLPGLDLSCVSGDHKGATYRAVQYLIQRDNNRIAFICHERGRASSIAERIRGFDRAAQEVDVSRTALFKLNVDDSAGNLETLFTEFLRETHPTAIISSSHDYAPVIVRVLKELGRANDVDLMFYDNEFAAYNEYLEYHPFIIDQQPREVGRRAAELLADMMLRGGKPDNIRIREKIIQI